MGGAEAEATHLAGQMSVTVAAPVQSCRAVVLVGPSCSCCVSKTVAIWFGVTVVHVSGLRRWWGLWLRSVRRFTAVTTESTVDGTEILERQNEENLANEQLLFFFFFLGKKWLMVWFRNQSLRTSSGALTEKTTIAQKKRVGSFSVVLWGVRFEKKRKTCSTSFLHSLL